jgi:hypothetical protein
MGSDITATVKFIYTPGMPGKMTLRNGDPGYPEERAEVEIDEVLISTYRMGKVEMIDIKDALKKEVLDKIEEELLEIDWVAEDRY